MDSKQDFFISHASDDKERYVQPLAECLAKRDVTFWLDSDEVGWGDSLALKINDGLRESRHVLLCLSSAFLTKPWPEAELNAAITLHTESGEKKVLPLILNSKREILARYPLIAGLVYREYTNNPQAIADELATLTGRKGVAPGHFHVMVESVHTGHLSNLIVPGRATIEWLSEQARRGAGLKDSLETGGFDDFPVRWVLVDSQTEELWDHMNQWQKMETRAVIKTVDGVRISRRGLDRLEEIGVYDDIVFHLYAVPDDPFPDVQYYAT